MAIDEKPDYLHVASLSEADSQKPRWLVDSLWLSEAVGIIGGAPKSCKSWLCLDLAVSVASQTPCLGRFSVNHAGTALIYLAEDSLAAVKARIEGICKSRSLNLKDIELYTITASSLRLDAEADQNRLRAMVEKLKPRLLVLDPLVRLHRLDENNASEMSGLLSFFRKLQREFQMAIILVHHAGKRSHARAGLNLRGSTDLHAFGDSNLYLFRKGDEIEVTIEHRSAAAADPLKLHLKDDHNAPHLAMMGAELQSGLSLTIDEQILRHLSKSPSPITREKLRATLKIKNERLGESLKELEIIGKIIHRQNGWIANLSL